MHTHIYTCIPQNAIYFLCAPNRELAEASPYFEAFKRHNKEVIFVYNAIDDFVMNNLRTYHGRCVFWGMLPPCVCICTRHVLPHARTHTNPSHTPIPHPHTHPPYREFKTAEATGLDLGSTPSTAAADAKDKKEGEEAKGEDAGAGAGKELTEAEAGELGKWLVETLPEKLLDVKPTTRLYDSPAIVTDHESGALRRMMRMVEQQSTGQASFVPKQHLEINPRHPIIVRLHALRVEQPELAKVVAEQMFDNAMVAAGLLDDSRVMLPRLNKLMELLVRNGGGWGK